MSGSQRGRPGRLLAVTRPAAEAPAAPRPPPRRAGRGGGRRARACATRDAFRRSTQPGAPGRALGTSGDARAAPDRDGGRSTAAGGSRTGPGRAPRRPRQHIALSPTTGPRTNHSSRLERARGGPRVVPTDDQPEGIRRSRKHGPEHCPGAPQPGGRGPGEEAPGDSPAVRRGPSRGAAGPPRGLLARHRRPLTVRGRPPRQAPTAASGSARPVRLGGARAGRSDAPATPAPGAAGSRTAPPGPPRLAERRRLQPCGSSASRGGSSGGAGPTRPGHFGFTARSRARSVPLPVH
jgi:hypothetical protein